MWSRDFIYHDSTLFFMWNYGFISGSVAWNGIFRSADGIVNYRNGWNESFMDIRVFPTKSFAVLFIYFLSGFVDSDNCNAGNLLLFCKEKGVTGKRGLICKRG